MVMRFIFAFLSIFVAGLLTGPLSAAEIIDTYGDWTAFKDTENGRSLCYAGSEPKKSEGKYNKRGDIYVLVTHRPAEKLLGVISVAAGYTYKPGSEPSLAIGAEKFSLFTDADMAWANDQPTDAAIVRAMKAGREMIVKGISSRGTKTSDSYSLKGFTAAYRAIGKACEVR